jgi:hypothetical protein
VNPPSPARRTFVPHRRNPRARSALPIQIDRSFRMRINSPSFIPAVLPSADEALKDKFDQLECEVDSKQATDAPRENALARFYLENAWPSR